MDEISFGLCLVFLALTSVLYVFFTAYFDQVWPSKYGQREHPLFCFSPSFWFPQKEPQSDAVDEVEERDPAVFEPSPIGTKLLEIRNLKKHFGSIRAVDGVSLDVMEGEVLCLLGHNGAGKTTTIELALYSMYSVDCL